MSYPSRIICKSVKPIPSMGIEYFYVGRTFSRHEVTSVVALTVGIVIFTMGDFQGGGGSKPVGFLFTSMGVLFDALRSNFQKKQMFSGPDPASLTEVMFFSSFVGSIVACSIFIFSSESDGTWDYLIKHPEILKYIVTSSVGGYLSATFALLLIKHFGPTLSECVKCSRKLISIGISFILIPMPNKKFNVYHQVGIVIFMGSVSFTVYNRQEKEKLQ